MPTLAEVFEAFDLYKIHQVVTNNRMRNGQSYMHSAQQTAASYESFKSLVKQYDETHPEVQNKQGGATP
jgi:hypothetical protein